MQQTESPKRLCLQHLAIAHAALMSQTLYLFLVCTPDKMAPPGPGGRYALIPGSRYIFQPAVCRPRIFPYDEL